jgi:hypothetical protein
MSADTVGDLTANMPSASLGEATALFMIQLERLLPPRLNKRTGERMPVDGRRRHKNGETATPRRNPALALWRELRRGCDDNEKLSYVLHELDEFH